MNSSVRVDSIRWESTREDMRTITGGPIFSRQKWRGVHTMVGRGEYSLLLGEVCDLRQTGEGEGKGTGGDVWEEMKKERLKICFYIHTGQYVCFLDGGGGYSTQNTKNLVRGILCNCRLLDFRKKWLSYELHVTKAQSMSILPYFRLVL